MRITKIKSQIPNLKLYKTMLLAFVVLMLAAMPVFAIMEIVVEAGREDAVYDYIYDAEDISLARPKSFSEIVSGAAGLNITSKSFPILQGDVFINGGSFEQTAILIDGVKLNSLQTGHYNLDTVFTPFDIEEVSVLKNASSIAGAGGFSGLINIKTKRHKEDSLKTAAEYGTHDTFYSAFSGTKMLGDFAATFSAEKSSSAGYHKATDYSTDTFYAKIENSSFGYNAVSAGFGEKDFGAFGYYGPSPSHEYVNTKYAGIESEPFDGLKAEAHTKTHYDHFIYNIDTMSGQNRHTEWLYGGSAKYKYKINDDNSISVKYGFDREEILSTRLGTRSRNKHAGLLNGFFTFEKFKANTNLGIEKYDVYKSLDLIPSAGINIDIGGGLKAGAAWSFAIRYPNYTELYYFSGTGSGSSDIIGNAALLPEKCQSYSLSLEYDMGSASLNTGIFYRNSFDLIDWGKDIISDPWASQNIGVVNTSGFNAGLTAKIAFAKLDVDYSYLDNNVSKIYIHKYPAMYLRNKFTASLLLFVFETRLKLNYKYINYLYRSQAQNCFDLAVSKVLLDWLEVTVKVENIFDYYFEEIPGIPAPGRMISCRVDIEL
jgi:vitamin B12 transporter